MSDGTYNIEVFCNGGLELSVRSPDADGDMKAIKALLKFRETMRSKGMLTNMQLYGKEDPHESLAISAAGEIRIVPGCTIHKVPHGKPHSRSIVPGDYNDPTLV